MADDADKVPLPHPPEREYEIDERLHFLPTERIPPIPHATAVYRLARLVIAGFLILLFVPLIPYLINPTSTAVQESSADLIKTEGAVLSGIVGAIVGYYYRTTQEKTP